MRSAVDSDLAEISARIKSAKKYSAMQKAMAAEGLVIVMARALERLAKRVDGLEESNDG